MTAITFTSYAAHDMPSCLAAVGVVRSLSRYAGIEARLSWGEINPTLHLPDGIDVGEALSEICASRSDSPHWDLLDTCDDGVAWETASREVCANDARIGGDFLTAAGRYILGDGGRSPLICTARNMTPGRWVRQSCEAAARTDWARHFERLTDSGKSWQGWRSPDSSTGADPAMVWLAIEGLTYFTCSLIPAWQRDAGAPERKDVVCPGWDAETKGWSFPIWGAPANAELIASLVGLPRDERAGRGIRSARFQKLARKQGNYWLSSFSGAAIGY